MINNIYSNIDKQIDYIPILSTITNLVNITGKLTTSTLSQETIEKSSYLMHLNEKSYARCVLSLIPFLGNIAILLNELNDIPSETLTIKNTHSGCNRTQNTISNSPILTTKSFNNSSEPFPGFKHSIDRKRYKSSKTNFPKVPYFQIKI